MVCLEFPLYIIVLQVDPALLLGPLLVQFIHPCPDLLLERSQLPSLLGPQCIGGSFDLKVPSVVPGLFLTFLQLLQPHLHLVSLGVSKSERKYSFCLAICYSIFFKFKYYELSFTLKDSCFSISFLRFSSSVWCLACIA